jgi:hypothetical protein
LNLRQRLLSIFYRIGVVDELAGPAVPPAAVASSIAKTQKFRDQLYRQGTRGLTAKTQHLLTCIDRM